MCMLATEQRKRKSGRWRGWGLSSHWNRRIRWNLYDNLNKRVHGCTNRDVYKKSSGEGYRERWKCDVFPAFSLERCVEGLAERWVHLWCLFYDVMSKGLGNYPQQWFFYFIFVLKKENALNRIKLITSKWFTAHQRTKQRNKMCQMNPSVRGGFQGSCVGVLCRLAEWEERQVNTWCQRECRSPYLSFFALHCIAGEIWIYSSVVSLLVDIYLAFYAIVWEYFWERISVRQIHFKTTSNKASLQRGNSKELLEHPKQLKRAKRG